MEGVNIWDKMFHSLNVSSEQRILKVETKSEK
jgi:hypothetical protein